MRGTLKFFILFFVVFVGFFGLTYQVCARSGLFVTVAGLIPDKNINPDAAIKIRFPDTVIPSTFENAIAIEPAIDFGHQWNGTHTELLIQPIRYWKPAQQYTIKLSGGRNIFFFPIKQTLSFMVADYPQITAFYPENESKDILIDMENPIRVTLDRPVNDFSFKFILDPFDDLEYQTSDDGFQISLLAKKGLQAGKKYSVSIMTKYKKEDEAMYRQIYASTFTAFAPKPVVAPGKFEDRLSQALENTKPQITSGKYIDVNLGQQVMVIFENSVALDAYMISSGKKGMETPAGSYTIRNKAPRPWSKEYSLFMPNWMALVPDGKFGIHELPEWPGGYKEGANHLGTPVSHGCIRLGVGSAKRVYEWAEIGTPVSVHY